MILDLGNFLLEKIFEKLFVNNFFENRWKLKCVCKRFRNVVSELQMYELPKELYLKFKSTTFELSARPLEDGIKFYLHRKEDTYTYDLKESDILDKVYYRRENIFAFLFTCLYDLSRNIRALISIVDSFCDDDVDSKNKFIVNLPDLTKKSPLIIPYEI